MVHVAPTQAVVLEGVINEIAQFVVYLLCQGKNKAREEFFAHVDKMIDSSHDVELAKTFPHGCKRKNDGTPVPVENVSDIDKSIARA